MIDKALLADTTPRLTIGAMSKGTGCNIETIRYYERVGLLPKPARTEGGHRMYGRGHLKRLAFIKGARELGFTIEEIRTLLGLAEGDHPCAEASQVASQHLAEVRAKIAALRSMEAVLVDVLGKCNENHWPECPLMEALFEQKVPSTRN
ncbi:MAG: helix-turn-helix domain-containing protein [Phenylobacterium sp.]|jgi:MerR family mercuric resistance operon transcriptional regulator|uniref:MerR family transcriptional regulator n=1 Tax=Phenylobacterium sp. TaxID=1871053 RepID=UPI001A216B5A|nr:helix-turn-helix domain-containing protein [Phenylobacterium sp.]MBJ7410200.1 helix-turn-helix domain-containing protein [Phenylobacterium sp.]